MAPALASDGIVFEFSDSNGRHKRYSHSIVLGGFELMS
jgi:hypothetical protein